MSPVFSLSEADFQGFESFYRFIPASLGSLKKTLRSPDLLGLSIPREEIYAGKLNLQEDFSDPFFQTYAVPTNQGLSLLALRLKQKHDLDIIVVKSKEDTKKAIQGEFFSKASPWGVIVCSDSNSTLHVTPYLCQINKDGVLEIADLDSVITPLDHAEDAVKEILKEKPDTLFVSTKTTRQADEYSCRTDALSILKQALLVLKNKPSSFIEFLLPEPCEKRSRLICNIPSIISKTCQTKSAIAGSFEEKVWGKRDESLQEFLTRSVKETVKKRVVSYIKRSPLTALAAGTESVEIEIVKKVNTYLIEKGFRNFHALQRFTLIDDSSLKAQMELCLQLV